MADKQKFIDSAQRNIKKKLLPRAIKDLQKVVEIDPRDIRYRQRLAELLVKENRTAEAFEQYETVAKYFATNGFYLKGIAIYKQMQRLDPSQVGIFTRLAELNEKQGLIGNALAELRQLVAYYEKNQMLADAIKTLEKMRDLDPTNLNVQVKLIEIHLTHGHQTEGLVELERVIAQLEAKQEYDKVLRLYKMFLPHFETNDTLQRKLAQTLFLKGDVERAIELLKTLLQDQPQDSEILQLLARAYAQRQDHENARLTYSQLLKLDPDDLDLRQALVQSYFNENRLEKALAELEDWKEAFLRGNRLDFLTECYERLHQDLPQNQQVILTLDSIYEITGEGDKLLKISATEPDFSRHQPEILTEHETLSDALLGTIDPDEDLYIVERNARQQGGDFPSALELEPVDETADADKEEILELDLSDDPLGLGADNDGLNLDLDLDAAPASRDVSADLEEAEFYLQQGLFDEAEKVCRGILVDYPDHPEVSEKLSLIAAQRGSSQTQGETSVELQDLAAELRDNDFSDFDAETPATELPSAATSEAAASFFADVDLDDLGADELFADEPQAANKKVFRTDVDEQIAADDMESHYNLGIAYREMGLLDDAIAEFAKVKRRSNRYVDCQTLTGLCFLDKGDTDRAEQSYRAALASDALGKDQELSLYYDLGTLYQESGRPQDALASFRMVSEQDANFRDLVSRIAGLQKLLGSATDDTPADAAGGKNRISFL